MKRILIPLVVLATAASLYAASSASVNVNNSESTLVTGGKSALAVFLLNSSGTETVTVSTVAGVSYAKRPFTLLPGGSLTFPSSGAPFKPNALYGSGNTAGKTNVIVIEKID